MVAAGRPRRAALLKQRRTSVRSRAVRNVKILIRDAVTALVICVPLLAIAIGAWASRNPDHPRIDAARRWPVVGDWIAGLMPTTEPSVDRERRATPTSTDTVLQFTGLRAWFEAGTPILADRATHSPTHTLEVPTRLEIVEQRGEFVRVAGVVEGWTPFSGDPISLAELPSGHRTTWVDPGRELLDGPRGEPFVRTDRIANLPVVDTGPGDWVQVIHGDRKLWLEAPDFTGGTPPMGSEPEPLRPLAAVPLSASSLAAARSAFIGNEVTKQAGPYSLLGDSPRLESLATACSGGLAAIDSELEQRTGLSLLGPPRETLIVFSTRQAYRAFLATAPQLPTSARDPDGYALPARGFAATFVQGRADAEICAVLVHEAAHLASRRALGPALPPWLAEGLTTWIEGRPLTALDIEAASTLVRMEEDFYATDLDRRYRTVAAIVRSLLTDPRWAPATRSFLADRAAGRPLSGGAGTSAADYWSTLVETVGADEKDIWTAARDITPT